MSNKKTKQKLIDKKNDKELRLLVEKFLQASINATAQTEDDASRIFKSANFSCFSGAIVELTSEVTDNLDKLILRAATLLGAKRGHEIALREIAMRQAQEAFLNDTELETAAKALIDKLFEEDTYKFRFLVPNYSITFKEDVRSIEIGTVRAMLTEDFAAELSQTHPDSFDIAVNKDFSFELNAERLRVNMPPVCWVVSVDAAGNNVDEEAKWLIDIALSFLRLHYTEATTLFPTIGTVEPHPLKSPEFHDVGIKISKEIVLFGGGNAPRTYQINHKIKSIAGTDNFLNKAKLIFAPPDKSLAERVGQGLGWLTRGRQTKDRAERLLYFFTAIESLLSSDNKTAPVVQNIARHAAVLLTNNNLERAVLAADLKNLYALRSALIHTGSRGVLWNNADTTQSLAEAMFSRVLKITDLTLLHTTFLGELSKASYGSPWPVNSSAKN